MAATYLELMEHIEQVEKLGDWIASCRMFGCDNKDQGRIIAADCFLTGTPLLEYGRRNKIVNNKPFKQYDAMLTEFHERGGLSKQLSRTAEKASIELTYKGETQVYTLTWKEAESEPFVYSPKLKESEIVVMLAAGKKPELKAKYATPRSRQTMLWARVVSDGIRALCPEVNYGTYTPEEISDIVDTDTAETVLQLPIPSTAPAPVRSATEAVSKRKKSVEVPSKEDEPSTEVVADPVTETSTVDAESVTTIDTSRPSVDAQHDKIRELMAELKAAGVDDIKAIVVGKLKEAGFNGLADLSVADADNAIQLLGNKDMEGWAAAVLKGHATSEIPF